MCKVESGIKMWLCPHFCVHICVYMARWRGLHSEAPLYSLGSEGDMGDSWSRKYSTGHIADQLLQCHMQSRLGASLLTGSPKKPFHSLVKGKAMEFLARVAVGEMKRGGTL